MYNILVETTSLKNRKGVTICPPYSNSDEFQVSCNPTEKVMVKYRIDPESMGDYSYGAGFVTQF